MAPPWRNLYRIKFIFIYLPNIGYHKLTLFTKNLDFIFSIGCFVYLNIEFLNIELAFFSYIK